MMINPEPIRDVGVLNGWLLGMGYRCKEEALQGLSAWVEIKIENNNECVRV